MSRNAAPTSLTGGRGFAFEDQIAAVLLIDMVTGIPSFGSVQGNITRIHWQARDKGWLLDDFLIETASANGCANIAVSVKSDRQVTSNGFPQAFVHDAWQLWLGAASGPFKPERDVLVLMVGSVSAEVEDGWTNLLSQIMEADPDRVLARLGTDGMASAMARSLFESFHCPLDLASGASTDANATVLLLRCVRLLHHDFLATPSRDMNQALTAAQNAVRGGTLTTAQTLWDIFIAFAERQRSVGGSADLKKVLEIPGLPALNEHPNYRNSWNVIQRISNESMQLVDSAIGGKLSVLRNSAFDEASKVLADHRIVILVGQSGTGKSALALRLVHSSDVTERIIWLGPVVMQGTREVSAETDLGIDRPLAEIVDSLGGDRAIVVIDGIDAFAPPNIEFTAHLIGKTVNNKKWSTVITTTPEGWEQLSRMFVRATVSVPGESVLTLSGFSVTEVSSALAAFPQIRHLGLRPELSPILANAKILDWIADESSQAESADTSEPVSLPSIVEWVWQRWIRTGPLRHARAETLKLVAKNEGANLLPGVPIGSVPNHEALAELEDDKILDVRREHVWFRHDLVGHWARLYVLIERVADARNAILEVASLPRWQQAVQLFGQWLLDRQQTGVTEWSALLNAIEHSGSGSKLAEDLLLESVVVTANAAVVLEKAWSELTKGDGTRLRRLLGRFLHIATFPDSRMDQLAETDRGREVFRATVRLPFWPLWLPVLPVLERHAEDIIRLAPDLGAEICTLWLKTWIGISGPSQFPCKSEAARLAIKIAREYQAQLAEGGHFREREDEKAWEAVFHAVDESADESAELILELIGRREISGSAAARKKLAQAAREQALKDRWTKTSKEERARSRSLTTRITPRGPQVGPWPDGPHRRIEEGIRRITLSNAIMPLVRQRPAIAEEVILAACIEAPHEGNPFGTLDILDDLGTWSWHDANPPMYFRGPFLTMLRECPDVALDTIIRLVNFATERSEESARRLDQEVNGSITLLPAVEILWRGQVLNWPGNQNVYGWYRGRLIRAPVIVSALMALEKWLYECLEKDKDIAPWINLIFANGRSVAFLGVLASVARRNQRTIPECLWPILSVWQIYEWERAILHDWERSAVWGIEMMQWSRMGERIFNEVRAWQTLPHRKMDFTQIAVIWLLSDQPLQEWFNGIRIAWSQHLDADDRESIELLIARFDPQNYKFIDHGNQVAISFEWPEPLRARTEAALADSEFEIRRLSFPVRCRQILDGESALEGDQILLFWDELRKLLVVKNSPPSNRDDEQHASIVLGGIAVLLRKNSQWVRSDPLRWKWCLDQVEEILKLPPHLEIAVPQSVGETMWDCFFGEVAIELLAIDGSNPQFRTWAAIGITAFHYNATKCAIRTAWRLHAELASDLEQILSLTRLWAGLRRIRDSARNPEHASALYGQWHQRLVESFVSAKIPLNLSYSRIGSFAARSMDRISARLFPLSTALDHRARGTRRRNNRDPGLDLDILKSMLIGILPLKPPGSAMRKVQLDLVREQLDVLIRTLRESDADEEAEIGGTPYDYDRFVFDVIAQILPELSDDENPEALWKPVLLLGPTAHYWVEDFLSGWLMNGYASAENKDRFFALWRAMIQMALSAPSWQPKSGRGAFHLDRMWIEMMGMGLGGKILIDDPMNAPRIETLVSLYDNWATQWLDDARVAGAFATFLVKPAVRPLLIPGIRWLNNVIGGFSDHQWNSWHLGSELAHVCACVWQNFRQYLDMDDQTKTAFLKILGILAEKQEPEGLQLRDEVLKAISST